MKKDIKKNKGMSLAEMIVAIGIFFFCLTGFSIFYIKIWKANAYIYETGQDTYVASRSVKLITDDMRNDGPGREWRLSVEAASDFELTAYIDIDDDGRTEKVHYFLDLDTDELKKGISEPSGSNPPAYSDGDDTVETLASHVVNESDDPAFSYFGRDYFPTRLLSMSP